MVKYIFVILFCVIGENVVGQTGQDEFLVSLLIQYEFDKVESLLNNSELMEGQADKRALSLIIYHRGQDSITDNNLISKLETTSNYKNKEIWHNLILSYYNLYNRRGTKSATEYANDAYVGAKKAQEKSLEKLSLLAFLQIYSQENTLDKRDFDFYRDEFRKLATQPEDFAWLLYYTNFFDGMSASFPERFMKSSSELYNFTKEYEATIPPNVRAYLYQNIALNFRSKKQLDSANVYLNQIISLADQPFLKKIKFNSHLELGKINLNKGNIQISQQHFNSAKNYFDTNDSLNSAVLFKRYKAMNYYEPLGVWDSAYSALKESRLNEAKLNYKNNNTLVSELNVQLRTAEKEKQILEEQAEKKRNRNIALGLGGSLVAVSIFAFLVYKNTKRKQRIAEQERELEIQKKERILKDQELNAIDAMIEGQEKERQRLASDLHDSVGATLSAAKLQFDHLVNNKDRLDKLDELFEKTGSLLDDAYNEVRSMAHLKNSGVIAKNGLLPAVEKLARNASGANGLIIEVQDFGLEERLENSMEIYIFRIIQELVTNIIKHAQATEASISITQHEEMLSIIVEDNGMGFSAKKLPKKDGMGLSSIERRIEYLEGTLEVDSTLGKGTSILIDLPL